MRSVPILQERPIETVPNRYRNKIKMFYLSILLQKLINDKAQKYFASVDLAKQREVNVVVRFVDFATK
jgi:hypothetical protein